MKEDYTDVIVILDRSGSMSKIANDMEGGFDQFIKDQRKVPGECKVSLTQFDSKSIDVVYSAIGVEQVPPLKLVPRSNTPLLDAVGSTIVTTGERLTALPEAERPGRVLVLVITDGRENASTEWTKPRVKALVEQQERDYNWSFVFLGANIDSFAEAGGIGFTPTFVANYSPDVLGVQNAFAAVSRNVANYRGLQPDIANEALAFSTKQREEMDGNKKKKRTVNVR